MITAEKLTIGWGGVPLLQDMDFTIERGDRIAQLVLAQVAQLPIETVESLDATERGAGGFGHTGTA